jgi:starvation-inducible outer membrane lipoprotein
MRTFFFGACLLLAGCAGGPEPVEAPQNSRSVCDSYAAQAIQSEDLSRATTLSAQASQCYADLQQ